MHHIDLYMGLYISALSSGKVLIDVDSKFTKGQAVSIEQTLSTTVWANAEKLYPKKPKDDLLFTGECSVPRNLFE